MTDKSKKVKWRQIMIDWQSSNESQALFCELRDISYAQFGYWRKHFSKTAQAKTINKNSIELKIVQKKRLTHLLCK